MSIEFLQITVQKNLIFCLGILFWYQHVMPTKRFTVFVESKHVYE